MDYHDSKVAEDQFEADESPSRLVDQEEELCSTCYNLIGIQSPELRVSAYAATANLGCNFCSIIHQTTLKFKDRWDQDDPYALWMNWREDDNVTRALGMTMMLKPPLDGGPDIHGGKMNNIEIFIEPGEIRRVLRSSTAYHA